MIGKKEVKTSIEIDRNISSVWNALSEAENVKSWNKVLIPLNGELKEGGKINYRFVQDENNTSEIKAEVKEIKVEKRIHQAGGIPGILTFNHNYILEANKDKTTVTIHEKYSGIMVPFWNPAPVEKAYARLLTQLKEHLENE
jgi:hypothetical protein